ncbi:MAG: AAA family ATPase [Planctomycetota bacterium]|nr:AAA family ATPase [Planctomycetota bacterium]
MNVLLIGSRGCGKSTLGRLASQILDRTFVDLDDRVLACFEESSVIDIWATHGEAAWRLAEQETLEIALKTDDQIIALGGGVPMIDAARRRMEDARQSGEVAIVYLRCPIDELQQRLRQETGDRPGLLGDDPVAEIEAVLAAREPTYRTLADHVLDMGGQTIEESTDSLVDWIRAQLKP